MTSAESVAARQWRPHVTECASPLDQPFIQSLDQDESSLLDVLERAQRTGVIDGADAALLIDLMLAADEARKVDQNGLAGRGSTTRRRSPWSPPATACTT